jgi:integrase/recombinase XerD
VAICRNPTVSLTPDQLPRVLSKPELDSIMAACREVDGNLYRMATFALWTGSRRREVLGVTWPDVRGASVIIRGKGKRERMIPLLPEAQEAMGEPRDIGPVFPKWHPDTVSHRFAEAAAKAGVDARFHDLRHTSATNMLSNGIQLPVVQKILGHADMRTTQIYAKVVDELVAKEMKKLRF